MKLNKGSLSLPLWIMVLFLSGSRFYASDPEDGRTFWFTYRVTIPELPGESQRVDLWVPIPRNNAYQTIDRITLRGNLPYRIDEDPQFGNRMAYFWARGEIPENVQVELRFRVTRKTVRALEGSGSAVELTAAERREFLSPDSLVPINDRILEEVRKAAPRDLPPLQKARAFYDYLVETMTYDKSGEGWGRGDALYACDVRKGNCTDFHSLFISMARAAGIPARFIIGFPVPHTPDEGTINGYHCWAEFFVPGKGWIPVDASEAHKHPDRRDFLFGGLDPDRVAFTLGRDIPLVPPVSSRKLNYFIYPFVLVNGKEYPLYETELTYRNAQSSGMSRTGRNADQSSDE